MNLKQHFSEIAEKLYATSHRKTSKYPNAVAVHHESKSIFGLFQSKAMAAGIFAEDVPASGRTAAYRTAAENLLIGNFLDTVTDEEVIESLVEADVNLNQEPRSSDNAQIKQDVADVLHEINKVGSYQAPLKTFYQDQAEPLAKVANSNSRYGQDVWLKAYAQNFVRAAASRGIEQETFVENGRYNLEGVKAEVNTLTTFLNAQGRVNEDIEASVQRLVNVIGEMGISVNQMPKIAETPANLARTDFNNIRPYPVVSRECPTCHAKQVPPGGNEPKPNQHPAATNIGAHFKHDK